MEEIRVLHRRDGRPAVSLTLLAAAVSSAALVSTGWDLGDHRGLDARWLIGAASVGAFLAAVSTALRYRSERWELTPGELRCVGRTTRSVPFDAIDAMTFESPRNNMGIPMGPPELELRSGRARLHVGHERTWETGEWDLLLSALAPAAARAGTVDRAARRLFAGVTGCVLEEPSYGRLARDRPAVRRHLECPHPDQCDPFGADI